jgi:hypothetical protein
MKYNGLTFFSILFTASLFIGGLMFSGTGDELRQDSSQKVFEMRTYTAYDGKLDDLHSRFSDHTIRLFEKHGMTSVGYWVPRDEDLSENTLIVLIYHESPEAVESNWESFRDDPEWQQVYDESHADGPLVSNVDRLFMDATPYSHIQ